MIFRALRECMHVLYMKQKLLGLGSLVYPSMRPQQTNRETLQVFGAVPCVRKVF